MYAIVFSVLVFIILITASLGSLLTYHKLASAHRRDDTHSVVSLVANFFVVMTSLMLGLMINSAKDTFETIDHNVHVFATELILLDKTLRDYGSEGEATRRLLTAYVQRGATALAATDDPPITGDGASERLLDDIGTSLAAIRPANATQSALLAKAEQRHQKIVDQRWAIVEHGEGTIPAPIIAMLVAWLVLIFASYGYRAPRNRVVVTTLVLAALLISTSLYLILDMDIPFSGPIRISDAPLQKALAEMRR